MEKERQNVSPNSTEIRYISRINEPFVVSSVDDMLQRSSPLSEQHFYFLTSEGAIQHGIANEACYSYIPLTSDHLINITGITNGSEFMAHGEQQQEIINGILKNEATATRLREYLLQKYPDGSISYDLLRREYTFPAFFGLVSYLENNGEPLLIAQKKHQKM